MQYVIICLDKPGQGALRTETRAAHLDYIKREAARMVYAGPMLDAAGAAPVGSLLIMEFDDLAAARAFAAEDPYNRAGLFESVTVRPIRQVLPAG